MGTLQTVIKCFTAREIGWERLDENSPRVFTIEKNEARDAEAESKSYGVPSLYPLFFRYNCSNLNHHP